MTDAELAEWDRHEAKKRYLGLAEAPRAAHAQEGAQRLPTYLASIELERRKEQLQRVEGSSADSPHSSKNSSAGPRPTTGRLRSGAAAKKKGKSKKLSGQSANASNVLSRLAWSDSRAASRRGDSHRRRVSTLRRSDSGSLTWRRRRRCGSASGATGLPAGQSGSTP